MGATLRDVAAAAGVSVKTVSNVVNGYVHVTPQMRSRVKTALADLDYRPNIAARNLRRGRTGLIALAVPSLRNAYFAELAHLIVQVAARHSFTVLVDCTDGELERERLVSDGFGTHLVDGLILCPHAVGAAEVRKRRDSTPLVLLSERLVRSADSVAMDSRAAARAATAHLIGLGRRRVGVLAFAPQSRSSGIARLRMDGYRAALADAGIDFDPSLVATLPAGHQADEAGAAARALVLSDPSVDGLFCFNDEFALGALRHLHSAGLDVPDAVAVIGVDDIRAGRLTSPSLSTVAPDKRALAETAVAMLLRRLADDDGTAPEHVVVDFAVVPRESTVGQVRQPAPG